MADSGCFAHARRAVSPSASPESTWWIAWSAATRSSRWPSSAGPHDAAVKLAEVAAQHNHVALVDELRPGWDDPTRRNELATRLKEASPNLTFLGIGAPRQELLAQELKAVVSGPIICCGAAVEVLAGVRPRAPHFLQRVGLEWAFRLAIEPRRLARRYLLAGFTFVRSARCDMGTSGGGVKVVLTRSTRCRSPRRVIFCAQAAVRPRVRGAPGNATRGPSGPHHGPRRRPMSGSRAVFER